MAMMSPNPEVRFSRSSRWVLALVALVLGAPWLSAFTSVSRPLSPHARSRAIARRAEADDSEVVDVEVDDVEEDDYEDEDVDMPEAKSVLDAGSNRYTSERYRGQKYKIWPDNTYVSAETEEKGKWNSYFHMPESEVERKKPKLMYEYFKQLRRLRRKMGNCRYRNGQLKFVVMMRKHPFTKEVYGSRYAENPEWVQMPGEQRLKRQKERARELERKLRLEAEELRMEKLQKMGVWTGNPEWRKATVPERQVRWKPRGRKGSRG